MLKFTVKRLASGVLLLVVISSFTFFLAHFAIGDPTAGLLGNNATELQRAALRQDLGLERPLLVQYWDWITAAATGDFGSSWNNYRPVVDQLVMRLPVTLSVVVFSMVIAAVFGLIIGVTSGKRPDGRLDRVLKMASVVLISLPGFWVSLVLVMWFAIDLQWFPAIGFVYPDESFLGWLGSITLPAVSLSLAAIVMIAEQLRNGVVEVSNQDYVRTLRARGLSNRRVLLHILRNASPAALTVLAVMFVGLLSGAIVVEVIFSLPGIGTLTQDASLIGDIPILLGLTVVTIAFVVIINLLLDVALAWINPKARVS